MPAIDELKTPYYSLPTISQEFIDEVFMRTKLCLDALETFNLLIKEDVLIDKKNSKNNLEKISLIRYIIGHFVTTEFFALFDGSSRLSLNLEKDKTRKVTKVQKLKLQKLFPSLSSSSLNKLHKKIQGIIKNNEDIFFKLMWTRHNKLVHANISFFEKNQEELKYNRVILTRLPKFLEDFQSVFTSVGFDDEF